MTVNNADRAFGDIQAEANNGTGTESTGPRTSPISDQFSRGILPRPKRKRRRAEQDRGLPSDAELRQLVVDYLQTQRSLWPELVQKGVFPVASSEVVDAMVEDFKFRHRHGDVDQALLRRLAQHGPKLAGGYFRYSCDNSNPRSISDQMVKCLQKAKEHGCLIPWSTIFADFSVTGLDATRLGYSSYKKVLKAHVPLIQVTYIDDFTRASRDFLEWIKLAKLCKRLKVGLIGASDGFNLNQPEGETMISVNGLVTQLHNKQLREKVRRGMSGAARRGTCLGKLPLGFTRKIKIGPDGAPVCGADGIPINIPCHDPQTIEARREMFNLFVNRNWSADKIAKQMNLQKVDGWDGWTSAGVKRLLKSPTAVGIFIWNQYRTEHDEEQDKKFRVRNPRQEWVIFIDKNLAVVDLELWKLARRKLGASRNKSPLTGKKQSRNQQSATTLFSGTLFCGDCGKELVLQRSVKNYKQLGCMNGWTHVHGCQLHSSKSTKVIEECLLRYLQDILLTPETFSELLSQTNRWIAQEAAKPRVNLKPLKTERDKIQRNIIKWEKMIDASEDEDYCKTHSRKISQMERELKELDQRIQDAQTKSYQPLKMLAEADVQKLITEIREVLNSDIPVAAAAIRELTGPISIRQEAYPDGKRGAKWFATFTPNFLGVLEHCLGKSVVGPLRTGGVVLEAGEVTIPIEKTLQYVAFGPKFKKLADEGMSLQDIAFTHGMSWAQAKQILVYAETGKRPTPKKYPKGKGAGKRPRIYTEIAEQVVELRVKQNLSFAAIARQLGVGDGTVRRAYNLLRPKTIKKPGKVRNRKRPRKADPSAVM